MTDAPAEPSDAPRRPSLEPSALNQHPEGAPGPGGERTGGYTKASAAIRLGVGVNLLLIAAKLIGGLAGNSFVLIADALSQVGDLLTSAAALVGMHVARRPADAGHPYGHGRAESLAGAYIALVLVLMAGGIGYEAIRRMTGPQVRPETFTLWIAAGSFVLKELLFRYKIRLGRRYRLTSLIGLAWDHRADALISLAVLAGLALVCFGGPAFAWANEVAALAVAGGVFWAGAGLIRQTVGELMDTHLDNDVVREARDLARSVAGVVDVEKLRARKGGMDVSLDIHIEVDPAMSVRDSHRIAQEVSRRLCRQLEPVQNVLVHVEPADLGDEHTHRPV